MDAGSLRGDLEPTATVVSPARPQGAHLQNKGLHFTVSELGLWMKGWLSTYYVQQGHCELVHNPLWC